MIQSFANRDTERLFREGRCPAAVEELRSPPGNRLEVLRGNRRGQWSIRINQQWRVCFRWGPRGPEDVEIVDYH